MTIIDDYFDYQQKYAAKYGKQTLVLIQIGHFFEAYGVDNADEKINHQNHYHLSDLLNIQLTRKNKSILENSRSNPLMIGVNLISKDKYIDLLLKNNYTIVLIEQVSEPPEPERKVTGIYSPGTNINYINKTLNNYCVSLVHDDDNIGISCIDISTGQSQIFEEFRKYDDKKLALDKAYRYIQSWNPKEIIVVSESYDRLVEYLEIQNRVIHKHDLKQHFYKLDYQRQFLSKVFQNDTMLSIHEYLDIEKMTLGTLSFMALLDFTYQHNETLINNIEKPVILNDLEQLVLANNSINQLNIVNTSTQHFKNDSVYDIINFCKTSIGKRYLYEKLVNPICNVKELEKRYDTIDCFRNDSFLLENTRSLLAPMLDIERLHRKILVNYIQPVDFVGLQLTYDNLAEILKMFRSFNLYPNQKIVDIFNTYRDHLTQTINFDVIGKYNLDKINENIFNKGVYLELDQIQESLDENMLIMKQLALTLSDKIETGSKTMVKLDYNERDGHFLCLTYKRSEILKKAFRNIGVKNKMTITKSFSVYVGDLEIKKINASQARIAGNKVRNVSETIRTLHLKLQEKCKHYFIEFLKEIGIKYLLEIKPLIEFVGNVDTYQSVAKASLVNGYIRPKLKGDGNVLTIKGIRHPIIERLQNDASYVINDLEFDETLKGMLLYGTNASGKSSLMKALGINVILAQAGFFVAASSMEFKPFSCLFTRINNNDNLFRGESSFAVEMSELRGILKRCSSNSLILGDELCSGTESISALSIFAASVKKLSNVGSTFIFATHLHELTKMDFIKHLDNVKSFHLKVVFDEITGKLIYDRKLSPGSGNAIYGLEVCKSMDMDAEFLEDANTIRKNLMNIKSSILEYSPSRYNVKVNVDKCGVCGKDAEDVHHIKYQCTADENDVIEGHIQKNSKNNLVPICKKCHDDTHHNMLDINGYVQTSTGTKLDYTYHTKESHVRSTKKKYDETTVQTIKEFCNRYKQIPAKTQIILAQKELGIKLSVSTLSKIKKGIY